MFMGMVVCKTSFDNQWLLDLFEMQIVRNGDKMFTMICDLCHVRGGDTQLVMRSLTCML
jgi:hypothetical protein